MEINQSQVQSLSLYGQLLAISATLKPLSPHEMRRREILMLFIENKFLSNADLGILLNMGRDSAAQWTRELKDLRYISISHKINHVIFYIITERGRNLVA